MTARTRIIMVFTLSSRDERSRLSGLAERRLARTRTRLARSGGPAGPQTTLYLEALEHVVDLARSAEVDEATLCLHLNHALGLRPGAHRPETVRLRRRGAGSDAGLPRSRAYPTSV